MIKKRIVITNKNRLNTFLSGQPAQCNQASTGKSNNPLRESIFGKKVVKKLPDNFFEKVLECEISLKKGFSMHILQELISYYKAAIEYYESLNDPKFKHYAQTLSVLLSQPDIQRQMNLRTKEGSRRIRRQEHKEQVKTRMKSVDHTKTKDDCNKIIETNNIKKENVEGIINKNLEDQSNLFLKRLEEKKKKQLLSKSQTHIEVEDKPTQNKDNKNDDKSLNPFGVIGKDENIFGNELNIDEIGFEFDNKGVEVTSA